MLCSNQISMTSSDLKRLWFIYTLRDFGPPQSWHRIRRFFFFAWWHREWWQVWRDCLCFRSNEIIISRFKWYVGCRCRAMYSLVNDSRQIFPFSPIEKVNRTQFVHVTDVKKTKEDSQPLHLPVNLIRERQHFNERLKDLKRFKLSHWRDGGRRADRFGISRWRHWQDKRRGFPVDCH